MQTCLWDTLHTPELYTDYSDLNINLYPESAPKIYLAAGDPKE